MGKMGSEQRAGLKLSRLAKIPQKSFKRLAETISGKRTLPQNRKPGFQKPGEKIQVHISCF